MIQEKLRRRCYRQQKDIVDVETNLLNEEESFEIKNNFVNSCAELLTEKTQSGALFCRLIGL